MTGRKRSLWASGACGSGAVAVVALCAELFHIGTHLGRGGEDRFSLGVQRGPVGGAHPGLPLLNKERMRDARVPTVGPRWGSEILTPAREKGGVGEQGVLLNRNPSSAAGAARSHTWITIVGQRV